MQGPGCSVKFLGVVWSSKTRVIPDPIIDKTQVLQCGGFLLAQWGGGRLRNTQGTDSEIRFNFNV
jgi:hypothetical protein